jgi:hypothetical protein
MTAPHPLTPSDPSVAAGPAPVVKLPRGHRLVGGRKAISLSPFAGSGGGEVPAQHPWPAETFLQGGTSGVVLRRTGGGYRTAFVEAHSDTLGFLRGEGATWQEAEDDAWAKARRVLSCPGPNGHDWEARGYTNGCGFCRYCGRFGTGVFTAEELGSLCAVCGTPTFWHRDDERGVLCRDHVPHDPDSWMCGCLTCLPRQADEPDGDAEN